MDIVKMNENTWRFEDRGVRFFLLEGEDKALLIDSGMMCPDAKQAALSLTDKPLELLNTHADPDHISGNGAFDCCYMNPKEEGNYRMHGGKTAILSVKEGDVIDLGGRPLLVIDIPGHTPGSIALIDQNNRVLISGDSVQDGNIFMFKEGRNMPMLKESLLHLKEYQNQFDEIYPSHGNIPLNPDQIDLLIEGASMVLDSKAQGKEADMFGTPVMLYRFPYAGFLCDMPEGQA